MIKVENVSKTFSSGQTKKVLDYVSVSIDNGEIVGLIGKSGEGKSTLARIMKGEFNVDCGNVYIDDIPLINDGKYDRKLGMAIQVIPQQPYQSLDPMQKVGNALIECLVANKIATKKDAKNKALELMKAVSLDESLFDRLPNQLSGGQAQRIVIARAIALKPQLIISDEATSMLDVVSQSQILDIFKELTKANTSILIISHDENLIEYMCDKIYQIQDGKITLLEKGAINEKE